MAGPTRTELRGEQSRDEILRAAETLMAARGYNATSMSDLIRESGARSSSIYWHFNSKAGVLAAVIERGAAAFFEAIGPALGEETSDPRVALEHVFHRSVQAIQGNPSFLTLYLDSVLHKDDDPAISEQIAAVRRNAVATVRAQVQASYASYGTDRSARIAERIGPLAVSFFDGLFVALRSAQPPDAAQAVTDVASALHHIAESIE